MVNPGMTMWRKVDIYENTDSHNIQLVDNMNIGHHMVISIIDTSPSPRLYIYIFFFFPINRKQNSCVHIASFV